MTRLYTIVILFFGIAFLVRLFYPHLKGWFGEMVLHNLLKVKLDGEKYRILHNVMLPTEDGATTQVDHVIVSQWGVFVIETKTYTGWIFGDAKSPQWTVTHFRRKDRFQNPLRQNYKHLATLSECLGIPMEYFKTIVAFSGEVTFKTEMPPEVMLMGNVPDYIRSCSQQSIIKAEQVPEIVEAIHAWQQSLSRERKAAHVENLRKNHSPSAPAQRQTAPLSAAPAADRAESETPTCPKCGAPMVFRTRKSDGGSFWGCSNYPKCRGIRQS